MELHKRSEFLEFCARTKALPTPDRKPYKPLSDVCHREDWQGIILRRLEEFEPKEPTSGELLDYGSQSSWHNSAHDGDGSHHGVQALDLARTANRAQDSVKRFVRQQLMYLLLCQCKYAAPRHKAAPAARNLWPAAVAEQLRAWHAAIPREVLAFYDAALLELLADRRLAGDMGASVYQSNLDKTRVTNGAHLTAAKEEEQERKVPARRELERLLDSAFYSSVDRPSPYWHLLQKPRSILDSIVELLGKKGGTDLVAWCLALFQTADNSLIPCIHPVEGSPWFYDPDRVCKFLNAARYALGAPRRADVGKQDAEMDARSADILEQELILFINACLEDPEEQERTSTIHRSTFGQKPKKPNRKHDFSKRSSIERVWWSSFLFPNKKEAPERLARWCNQNIQEDWTFPKPSDKADRGDRTVVLVYGAGIAGLTAAHELAERNFQVHVIEASSPDPRGPAGKGFDRDELTPQVGGMARTQWDALHEHNAQDARRAETQGSCEADTKGARRQDAKTARRTSAKRARGTLVPGEHGYRLFPSFYRHVFDTMKRTPIAVPGPGLRPTAFNQLEPTFRQVFAARKGLVPLSRERPRSLEAFRTEYMRLTQGLGFSRRDLTRFFFKLVRYLMTCSARREKEYEGISLFTFLGADQKGFYSEPFIQAIRAAPQALVAMDAEHCDARTQANVYLQLLLDQVLGGQYTDCILSGPTSHAWLIPWRKHLEENLDVKFHQGELLSITGTGKKLEVLVRGQRLALPDADYHVVALDAVAAERVTRWWNSSEMSTLPHDGVPRELRGFTSYITTQLPAGLGRYELAVTYTSPLSLQEADDKLRNLLRRVQAAEDDESLEQRERSVFRSATYSTGQTVQEPEGVPELRLHFWFDRRVGPHEVKILETVLRRWARPAEDVRLTSESAQQFPQAVRVTTPRLPGQRYGDAPGDRLQTFTGVQYYFDQDFKLVRGHVYFPDTEWGLSAVSQSQFWVGKHFDAITPRIRGVLSVDIGSCCRRSSFTGKSLMDSSPDEIQREVWRQIKDSLRTIRGAAAPVTNLPLPEPLYYHLDSNLVFAGSALRANRTPFLINRVGDWDNRPRCMPWVPGRSKLGNGERTDGTGLWQAPHGGYRVHEDKVVFCGSYMRTFTRMNTMEAANESARHAVNAILDHMASTHRSEDLERAGITGDYCDIWDIEEHELDDLAFFKRVDEMLFRAGKPHIADILQFDKIADVAHPDPSPGQSLLAALGATLKNDWGADANDLAGSLNGLMEIVRAGKDLAGSLGGDPPNLQKLLSLLGAVKAGPGKQAP
ncbi:NAD(P)-binding protein [Sorangium sp. So ce834]|uniref:NAD(P)-binding protein n=1 Tax=Sorangium sp. So ce834 TaxID=3133321 RepID=UPI003F60C9D1